jgi:hypothetical protein
MNEKFADQIDQASALEQMASDARIKHAQSKANTLEFEPVGHCLFCEEPFEDGSPKRFCNADCRDDYELLMKFRK